LAIRLKDIAAELGVSTITVSKVLRNKPDVGEATRQRILQRVKELNYRPNLMARGLASGRSHTVGLIVPDLVHTFFAELAKGLKAGLRSRGYQLILASAEEEPELEQEEIDTLLARGVDALVIASCQTDVAGLQHLADSSVPCVLLDRRLPDFAAHFVGSDDVKAGLLATEHLLSLGRTRIAHIGTEGVSTGVGRLHGYRNALKKANIALSPGLLQTISRTEETGDAAGYAAMTDLLKAANRPDAVFCYNDISAVGAIRCLLAAGLHVPNDVAVIGCGNLRLASYLEVPLSSIDQGAAELGEQAAKLTTALLGGDAPLELQTVHVEPRVIARASTIGKGIGQL
jgi:LacI family transcriptional regulator